LLSVESLLYVSIYVFDCVISMLNACHCPYNRHLESAQFSNTSGVGADITRLYTAKPGSTAIEAFDHDEEQRSLELLLSQERVVSLIYAKTFPILSSSSNRGLSGGSSRGFGKTTSSSAQGGVRPNSSHNPTSTTFMMPSAGIDGSLLSHAGGLEAILNNVMVESDDVVSSKE